jgi:hypothetical protein
MIVAMLPEEGAAMRVQLDSMLAALEQFDQEAAEVGDGPVMTMIARLHEARAAAVVIETRGLRQKREHKGVRLVKTSR